MKYAFRRVKRSFNVSHVVVLFDSVTYSEFDCSVYVIIQIYVKFLCIMRVSNQLVGFTANNMCVLLLTRNPPPQSYASHL